MNKRLCRLFVFVMLLLFTVAMNGCANLLNAENNDTSIILGLDHIPLAVADLENAAETYRKMGFTIKPGRDHENGIKNLHIKFLDGTEIELITASKALDSLTSEYLNHLASGDGAAFVGFYSPNMERLVSKFTNDERTYEYDGGLLTFPESDELRYIFFGQRNRSPTDQPEHFEHLNGAEALIGVWIAGDDLELERRLFNILGAEIAENKVQIPDSLIATVVKLPQAEVLLLPGSRQLVPSRRIIGATIRTRNLNSLQSVLTENSRSVPPVVFTANGQSMFIPPSMACGIWLEFRQEDG